MLSLLERSWRKRSIGKWRKCFQGWRKAISSRSVVRSMSRKSIFTSKPLSKVNSTVPSHNKPLLFKVSTKLLSTLSKARTSSKYFSQLKFFTKSIRLKGHHRKFLFSSWTISLMALHKIHFKITMLKLIFLPTCSLETKKLSRKKSVLPFLSLCKDRSKKVEGNYSF